MIQLTDFLLMPTLYLFAAFISLNSFQNLGKVILQWTRQLVPQHAGALAQSFKFSNGSLHEFPITVSHIILVAILIAMINLSRTLSKQQQLIQEAKERRGEEKSE
eukprot:TRINITY_DN953_c0_g1_i3.p1 TRINITY_DN953_c0_g1~~TRINITY_DN953_c0_g1_i3.p1  ORF type:complete len:105 (+),score=24.96 TRINITY_DN953_c0_g1_i3:3-317(+)